ncbi:MAG: sugar ABC transporter substrate-binding protein [Chloroflexota bacterium]
MLQRLINLLICVGLAALLAGCGASAAEKKIDEPFIDELPPINPKIALAENEKITLEVWLDLDFTRNDTLFQEIAADFEAAYQNKVDVNIQSFVGESMPQKVRQAVLAGTPPDVVQGHVYAMAGQGLAEPLNRRWEDWEVDPEKEFLPAALAEVTWKQTRYGIPLDIYTLVWLYNRQHFDEVGLPYPGGDYDFAFLQTAAGALTNAAQDRYGLGFTTDPWYVYTWLTNAGGDVLTGTPETDFNLTLDSTSNIDALRFLTDMAQAGYGPPPTTRPRDYEDARELFLAGKVSMYMGGPWDIHLIQSTHPDFPLGVAQLPQTPAAESAASVLGSTGLFIPRGASHQDLAFEFMKWATSDRYAIPMARRLGRYPAKIWLQTSPYFTENLLLIPFFNQLNAARPYHLDLFPPAEDAFQRAIKASFYGVEPAEALHEAQRSVGRMAPGEQLP